MPSSSTESTGLGSSPRSGLSSWLRKSHYYLGLFTLAFTWLFAFTGLLLNHPGWKFAEFWENRRDTTREYDITVPASGNDLDQARAIASQLGLRGEIEWTSARSDGVKFDFRVSRPGQINEINSDFGTRRARVKTIAINTWGVMRILHTFTGVHLDDARNTRDWWLTIAWAFSMDAVAVGLIAMVLTSLWLWWQRPERRLIAGLVLLVGCVACGWFCFGLRWLYT